MVRIKADCGGGDLSSYSSVINFNSAAVLSLLSLGHTIFKYMDNFRSRTAPYCWKNIDTISIHTIGDTTAQWWKFACAYYYGTSSTTTQNNAWLCTELFPQ